MELERWSGSAWQSIISFNGVIFGTDFGIAQQDGLFVKAETNSQWQSAGGWY